MKEGQTSDGSLSYVQICAFFFVGGGALNRMNKNVMLCAELEFYFDLRRV